MLRKKLLHCLLGTLGSALMLMAFPTLAQDQGAPEVCKACHSSYFDSFAASKHGQQGNVRGPATHGSCLACHGQGALEHAKQGGGRGVGGIINPASTTLPADQRNAGCMSCHKSDSKRSHWMGSTHQEREVACASCHSLHAPRDKVLDKITQPQVCFSCHKEQRAEIDRPSRHAITEGKVACSDCHNPHGSVGPKLMKRDSVVETCYQCHMEKRGPFVHEHEPVSEDCSNCHNPHGTVAEFMLKMRPPMLCHQCHTPHGGQVLQLAGQRTPALNTSGSNGVQYTQARGCLNCHTEIHGSNNASFTAPPAQFFFR